jgi:hypothetical protein
MRTKQHYERMLTENPNTSIGFTLAAEMVYAARHDGIHRSVARLTDEWRNIARTLKGRYGESLTVDQVRHEMSPVVTAAALLGGRGGKVGGLSTSSAKAGASRANGAKGGRPPLVNKVQVIDRLDDNRVVSEHRTWTLAERAAARRSAGDRYGLRTKYPDMAEPPRE